MSRFEAKFAHAIQNSHYNRLPQEQAQFLYNIAQEQRLSFQEIRQSIEIAVDIGMWDEGNIKLLWETLNEQNRSFKSLKELYEKLKTKPNSYKNFAPHIQPLEQKYRFVTKEKEGFGLGLCPVASQKTRCCNLLTLDAVESCGFDCSYCSIQSFYNQNTITFDASFAKKLLELELNPDKTYHIGTGQSSDSLMWGNKEGLMDALFTFAKKYPNLILEFKSKSDNIAYLLENPLQKNILCTWSLNTQTIIQNEEHLTASLQKRINAARAVADKGYKVGFHFHPIVEYEGYLEEYGALYAMILDSFKPHEVALVSFGTLTFIKSVIKKLREREFKTKITQIPHTDASGKSSYPHAKKVEMFSHAYKSFAPWHKDVFFYLCMEEHGMWQESFGYGYATNNDFEQAMLFAYTQKLGMPYLI